MKKILIFSLLFASNFCSAALPPEFQNQKDLRVMIKFVEQHSKVISTLQSIDFKAFIVYFDKNCRAEFSRNHKPKPEGWVGPADPLVFSKSNCTIDD